MTFHFVSMIKYFFPICVPEFIDRIVVAPLLLLRWVWYGYTFRRIKLANCNKYAIVDQADYCQLKKSIWFANIDDVKIVRAVVRYSPENHKYMPITMHRKLMEKELNYRLQTLNQKLLVDHINNNPLDNRRSNLRLATRAQNVFNSSFIRRKTASKYKGVSWQKKEKKWVARITYNRKVMYLGAFEDEIEAAKAYDRQAKKYFKEFAYLNFPQEKVEGLKGVIKHGLRRFWTKKSTA